MMAAKYAQGSTLAELCLYNHIDVTTLKRIFISRGIRIRSTGEILRKKFTDDQIKEILRTFDRNGTISGTAAIHKTDIAKIRRVLIDAGIPIPGIGKHKKRIKRKVTTDGNGQVVAYKCCRCDKMLPPKCFYFTRGQATSHCKVCESYYKRVLTHGLVPAQYDALFATQAGRCAICGVCDGDTSVVTCLHIDHDHATGVVRGLLCSKCNRGLGHFTDSPDKLIKAAAYLRLHGK